MSGLGFLAISVLDLGYVLDVNTPFIAYAVPQICPIPAASTDLVAVAKNVSVTRNGDILQ